MRRFELNSRALSTVDDQGVRVVRPGKVDLWIGGGQPGGREGLTKAAGTTAEVAITSRHAVEK